jgi:hypothetical protein
MSAQSSVVDRKETTVGARYEQAAAKYGEVPLLQTIVREVDNLGWRNQVCPAYHTPEQAAITAMSLCFLGHMIDVAYGKVETFTDAVRGQTESLCDWFLEWLSMKNPIAKKNSKFVSNGFNATTYSHPSIQNAIVYDIEHRKFATPIVLRYDFANKTFYPVLRFNSNTSTEAKRALIYSYNQAATYSSLMFELLKYEKGTDDYLHIRAKIDEFEQFMGNLYACIIAPNSKIRDMLLDQALCDPESVDYETRLFSINTIITSCIRDTRAINREMMIGQKITECNRNHCRFCARGTCMFCSKCKNIKKKGSPCDKYNEEEKSK